MSLSRIMKWVTGICEGFLGIPIVGDNFIISFGWGVLLVMLIMHIMTLLIAHNEKGLLIGNGLGIITSSAGVITTVIGIFPLIGMVLHMITGLVLVLDAALHKQ